jgi:ubiquitin-protein ligase
LISGGQPLVGVSAKPLPNDMFTWHGNIKPHEGSMWKDVVIHFQMTIPRDYPVSPPDIHLYNTIPHPNIFGNTLCLDMTTKGSGGWSVAYTIESVLIQL